MNEYLMAHYLVTLVTVYVLFFSSDSVNQEFKESILLFSEVFYLASSFLIMIIWVVRQ